MFDCRACLAKDAEIARLWKALTESHDRFQALTGTLSEVSNAREMSATVEPEPPGAESEEREQDAGFGDDDAWAQGEIERTRLDLAARGVKVTPDFPA